MRAECDEMADDAGDEARDAWLAAVAKAMNAGAAKAKDEPVCGWEKPESEILAKNLGPDGFPASAGGSSMPAFFPILAILVAIAAYFYLNK